MSKSKNFSITVTPFEGDPNLYAFFVSQIEAISDINKWTIEEKTIYLKSKLTGAALKFLIDSQNLNKCTYSELKNELGNFFSNKSQTASVIDFNNLHMLPQESIKNFAHRLNSLTSKVYDITDQNILDNIKFIKLIGALPPNIRTKILEENVKIYQEVVNRAQQLQDIACNEAILVGRRDNNDAISVKLNELSEKINALTFNPNKDIEQNKRENRDEKNKPCSSFHKNRVSNRSFFKTKQSITCQICSRIGHSADKCFRFTRLQNKSSYNARKTYQNNQSRYQYRNKNYDNNVNYQQNLN